MIVFPNCKINLGLNILGKRADGYHDLSTIFYPVPLCDILEVIENKEDDRLHFSNTGIVAEADPENNLCLRAFRLLQRDYPQLPALILHLHKIIPMGAGLGGGSADASFLLKLLNEKFRLSIPEKKLNEYALQLGSDCPFFLLNKPSIATGRGETLKELNIDLSACQLQLIHPGIHVNTGWAFAQLKGTFSDTNIQGAVSQPVARWKELLRNDLEAPVFEKYPEIHAIKKRLYEAGAVYASMSGSGSTVFGLFDKEQPVAGGWPDHYLSVVRPLQTMC